MAPSPLEHDSGLLSMNKIISNYVQYWWIISNVYQFKLCSVRYSTDWHRDTDTGLLTQIILEKAIMYSTGGS